MLVDTHAHITSNCYENVRDIISKAKEKNVLKILNCSTSLEDAKEVLILSKNHKELYSAIGIHPEFASYEYIENIKKLEDLIKENLLNIKAIGEIGLDFYHTESNKVEQIILFRKQLELAQKYNLPVSIHSRNSSREVLNILKDYSVTGAIHCFSASLSTAKQYIGLGLKLGIGGISTYNNTNIINIIREVGLEQIVLETDCPYLSPEPNKKSKNEPGNISLIAKFISESLDIPLKEVSLVTTKNAMDIFDLK